MRGIVKIDDGSVVHVIPRAEIRRVEVAALGGDGYVLRYQLVGGAVERDITWLGDCRPASLKASIEIGEYNQLAAAAVQTTLTRGYGDVHLERRADNVFLVRSGLIDNDARVVMCRQFIVDMVARLESGALDDRRQTVLHEIRAAARDLVLPDGYPIKEEPR